MLGKCAGSVGNRKTSREHCGDWSKYIEETWISEETCYHLNSIGKLSANAGVKDSQKSIIIIIIIIADHRVKNKESEKAKST